MIENRRPTINLVAWALLFVYASFGFYFTEIRSNDRADVDKDQNAQVCVLIDRVVGIQKLRASAASNTPIPSVSSAEAELQRTIDFLNTRSIATNAKANKLIRSLHC